MSAEAPTLSAEDLDQGMSLEQAFAVPDLFDPEGDDEDDGCPPDVLAILGFDPDEEDKETENAYSDKT